MFQSANDLLIAQIQPLILRLCGTSWIFKNEHKKMGELPFQGRAPEVYLLQRGTFCLPPPSPFLSSLCPQRSPPLALVVYLVVWPKPHCSRHQDKINIPVYKLCCLHVLPSCSSLFMLWNARFNNSSFTLEGCPHMLQPVKPKVLITQSFWCHGRLAPASQPTYQSLW